MARLRSMLVVGLLLGLCPISGCVESSFQLANGSRLPQWITLAPGVSREDVSITLEYSLPPAGGRAKFIVKDKAGRKLSEISGKTGRYPLRLAETRAGFPPGYPMFEVVTVNGVEEVIEHRKMEPVFYVEDDPEVRSALLAGRSVEVK